MFRDWTFPRQKEAPESLLLWSGLFTLSSALKHHVRFPKSIMGSYEIIPNMYIVFVGPPGVIKKSTVESFPTTLLLGLEDMNIAPSALTDSKLIEILSNIEDSSLTILSSEFANLVKVSREDMYAVLTDLFDGKLSGRGYDYSTRMHGTETVERPCINLLAATTPDWISSQPPEHLTGGGFSSRVVFIFENKRREAKMYYAEVDDKEIERLEAVLKNDLAHIAGLHGDFRHENTDLMADMEQWYQRTIKDADEAASSTQGYYNRRHVHVHKVAMLLSVARDDDLIIKREDFDAALAILKAAETNMPRAMATIGKNPLSRYMLDITDFIETKGTKVTFNTIWRRFYNHLRKDELKEVITALVQMNKLKQEKDKNGSIVYRL